MSDNKQDLFYWKENAEMNYIGTHINVLKYIQKLEDHLEREKSINKAKLNLQWLGGWMVGFFGLLSGLFLNWLFP